MDNIETAERYCQNCGVELTGNYCSNCGQKRASLHNKSIKSLLEHFFEEFFTWDSRFFLSIKYLFIRPGFLTHEYVSSRYQSYISPIKMFLFTSFVLFFIMLKSDPDQYKSLVTDSEEDNIFREFILDQRQQSSKSQELYETEFNNKFNDNVTLYIMFIMLAFSVMLKIVYLPKNYFYAEHVVFTLHFFTFVLWCFLFGVIVQGLGEWYVFSFWYFVPAIYLFFAVKNVYHKTILGALLISIFMMFYYWVLITFWVFGTIYLSAIRAV